MADAEEPRFNSLAERIAALNKQKNFNVDPSPSPATPGLSSKRRPPPAPPVRSANTSESRLVVTPASRPDRQNAPPPLPRRDTQDSGAIATSNGVTLTVARATPPPLPSRTSSSSTTPLQSAPPLPRRTSTQSNSTFLSVRRNSASSELSQFSNLSTSSLGRTASSTTSYVSTGSAPRMMAPATWDPANLPALPPSKRELEAKEKEKAAEKVAEQEARSRRLKARQAPDGPQRRASRNDSSPDPAARPRLPPRLPSRPVKAPTTSSEPTAASDQAEDTRLAARKVPLRMIRGFGSGQADKSPSVPEERPPLPSRPSAASGISEDSPPPLPLSSRPSVAQIEAASVRHAVQHQDGGNANDSTGGCWVCRDWSAPDNLAAQFPTHSLPRHDPVGYLARKLCDPFPSFDDKARAIFTWCHHNIAYDTVSFFNNNVRHHTVEDTIFSGLAVCQGYAETYKAIANRAGLECIVVGGHGKGFGHEPLKKGQRAPPAKPDGHAWNAVRVDGGAWKLIDACWGAGHLCGGKLYKQEFSPRQFTLPNEKFGLRHFPQNSSHQFRNDGRTVSWDEYYTGGIDGEPVQWFGTGDQEGIAQDSLEPKVKEIAVYSGQVVRFQFSKNCEHWTSEKAGLGRPALFLLSIHGLDGRKDEVIPIDTNGFWHWVDVDARDLGAPGQTVEILKLETMEDRDARGVDAREFLAKKGRVGMSWSYIAKWKLV